MCEQREKEYSAEFRKLLKEHGSKKVDKRLRKGGLPYSKAISCAETFDDIMRCWIISRSSKQEEDAMARMKKIKRTEEQSKQLWRVLSEGTQLEGYRPKWEMEQGRRSVYRREEVPQKRCAYG